MHVKTPGKCYPIETLVQTTLSNIDGSRSHLISCRQDHLMNPRFLALAVLLMSTLQPHLRAEDDQPEWEPDIYPQNNIFPSFIIGTARVDLPADLFSVWEGAHLGDPQGVIGVIIPQAKAGSKIEVTVKANEFMEESRLSQTLKKDSRDLLVHPKIAYKFGALAKVTQAVPLNVTIALSVDGKSEGEKTVTATLRSINDCLFGVEEEEEDESSGRSDYSWLFTAYVNENHPWVDTLLKEALDTEIVAAFDGYQSGNADQVLLQIFAIWNVMQRHGLKYSDVTTTAAENNGVYSQHVRLFDESVKASQANCVDGSVLLAAMLRKIGLRPALVLLPGHMFLAVYLDDDTIVGLETTLLGQNDLRPVNDATTARLKKLENKRNEESWDSFEAALSTGTNVLEQNADKIEIGDDLSYQWIDIAEARSAGILPITYTKKD